MVFGVATGPFGQYLPTSVEAVMAPVLELKIVGPDALAWVGSTFGSNHGFTQLGATGIAGPLFEAFAPDGL